VSDFSLFPDQCDKPTLDIPIPAPEINTMSVLQIQQMTLSEKLRAMEALWEELCRHEEQVPVPQWHKDILDERERLVREGKAKFVDWETAKKQIAGQLS
jgi:hypothetical protein